MFPQSPRADPLFLPRVYLQERTVTTTLSALSSASPPDVLPPLRNPPVLEGTEDLTNLSYLNEPSGTLASYAPWTLSGSTLMRGPRAQCCTRSSTATRCGPSTPTRASSSSPSTPSRPSRASTTTLSSRHTPRVARASSSPTCSPSPKRRTGAWWARRVNRAGTRPSLSVASPERARQCRQSTSCGTLRRWMTQTSRARRRCARVLSPPPCSCDLT